MSESTYLGMCAWHVSTVAVCPPRSCLSVHDPVCLSVCLSMFIMEKHSVAIINHFLYIRLPPSLPPSLPEQCSQSAIRGHSDIVLACRSYIA
jgi:hypothetical protein